MGLMNWLFGAEKLGQAVSEVAEVFRPNAEHSSQRNAALRQASLQQYAAEFGPPRTWFDSLVNGLNRLPRPVMAFGAMGLFVYAGVAPEGFAARMMVLSLVPEPLWWLTGAIVSFYFGAREFHHARAVKVVDPALAREVQSAIAGAKTPATPTVNVNAPLEELLSR